MICPGCGKEMIAGCLMADGSRGADLYWMPKGEDVVLFRTREKIEKKGGILLGMPNSSPKAEAHHCAACKKLLVSYE